MADDGSGNFSLPSAPFVAGTAAVAADVNANFSDIATGLTARVTRNGSGSMSGNLAMGANRVTGMANGTAATDAAALGQVMQLIERQTIASPVAVVDFDVPSGYVRYQLVFSRVVLATNNASLYLRGSVNDGVSFLSTNEYAWGAVYNDAASAGFASGNAAAQVVISGAASNASNLSIAGRYNIDVGTASLRATLTGEAIAFDNAAGVMLAWNGGASIAAGADVDALRVLASTGNISSGIFELWGTR